MPYCCVKTILLFFSAFATISTHVSTHTNEDSECENHKTVEFDLIGDSQIANSIMHAFPCSHPSYSHFQPNTKHTVAAEFVMVNSSAELKWLSIVQVSGKRGVVCTDSSSVRVVECALKLDRSSTKSMFYASRAALVLTNITLSFPFAHSAAQPLISSHPLTHTVQHNSGRVAVESSLIASVCIGAEPFLSPIHVPAIHLASTVFINVTQPHASCADAKRDGGMTEEQHTLIDSCLMDRVENGYDGGIVWGMSVCKGSFTAWNSSFCRSTRTACQRIEHSGSATTDVNECAFHNNEGSQYGGAIYHQSTGTCSIQNSEFDDCQAKTAGGACNIIYSSKVTVGTCVFSNCSANEWAGTLRLSFINQLNVNQCNTTNSAAHWAGGTVEATEIRNGSSFSNNIITSGKVITPDNNETGGGIWCSNTFGMVFSECLFRSCSSENSVGGAMSFSTREYSYLITKLSFCFFDGNQASSTGADIYASQEWSTVLVESNIVECRTSTTAPNRLFVAGSDRSHLMNRLLSQAFVSKHNGSDTPLCGITLFPCSTLGFSLTLINRSAHPVSITFAPGTYPEAEAAVDSLVLQVAGHKSSTTILPKATTRSFVSLTSGQLTFVSFTVVHGSPSAQPASHPLFSVSSTAAAWIKNCLITADTAQNNVFGAPLITMDGGALAVENCEINTITLSEAPLIRAAVTAELALTNITISAVQRGVGSGAGAECDIEDGGAVEMNNVSLSGCTCSKGDGGGVWARLRSGGRLQMGAVSAVSFEGCTAPNGQEAKGKGGGVFVSAEGGGCAMVLKEMGFSGCAAWKGNNVFVEAPVLRVVVSTSSMGFSRSGMSDEDLMGFEDGHREDPLPLAPFLKVFSPPAFVGGAKGRDFSACGFAEHPCVSIGKAAGLWFSGSKRSIILHTGFVWREEIELGGNEWSIQCEEKGDEVGVAPSAPPSHPALITTTRPAQLINVVFALPQTLSQSTTHLLCCKGATLTLTSCGIKTAGGVHSVAFVPLAVTDGKIEATNLVCSAMALAGQPLMSVAGAGAEGDIGKLSVESVSTTAECGLLEVANGGSLRVWNSTVSSPTAPLACPLLSSASAKAILLQNSTFANFDRASRNGGCIECTLADGSSLAVAGCTLSECCSRGANGGGIWVEMKSGSHFSVEGSTDADAGGDDGDGRVAGFDTCSALKSAEGEHGCGGGVYVDAEEGATDFVVGDVVFASCTAEKGSSLFVCGYDLLALINEHSLGAHREEADLAKLAGFERCATDSSFCIPLVVYLWTNFTADGFVDGAGGGDFSRCGFSEAPCRTVDHIVSTRFAPLPQRPSTITIASGSTITKALNLLPAAAPAAPQPLPSLTMQGAAQAARLSVFDLAPAEQDAFLASAITLTLHSLALCIPAALRQPRAFFCSSSRALCISACSFELREGSMLAYSLILVEEGSFSASQLAIGTDSSATAVSCLPPLVVIRSSGSVSLAGCSVAGVSHSQGNGSWAAAECQGPSARLCIANSTVCGCSAAASDGAGGGLLCSAAGGATVEISNTSFTLCSVSSEGTLAKGVGGGVFLDCAGAASGFQLSNTSFDQCSAWKGKNLFVCADSLSQLVTRTSMNFTFAIGVDEAPDLDELSGIDRASASLVLPLVLLLRSFARPCVVGGEDGVDASLCGYPDYPCQTIPYAASSRFGQSLAALRLQPPFSFRDTLCLCSQPLAVDSAAAGTQIDIRADGEGEGEALVETGIEVGLSGMCFGLPSSFAPRPRAALFWCSAATLTFTACTTAAPPSPLQYSFAVASSGTVLLCQFAMHSTAFAASPAFLLEGSSAAGSFVELHLRSTTTNAPNGLIRAASGASLRVENSTIADATMDSSEVICSPLTTTLALKNTSFANITRLRGSGGLVVGAVSGGRKFSFANCTMERCSCIESGSTRGGGVVAEVKKGGEWVFEKSTASECTVDGLAGCGGGLFLRFAVADVRYSMKGIAFAANDAWLGKDVYLVCPAPHAALHAIYWEGSAADTDPATTKWVHDDSAPQGANVSILFYLFPPSDEIVYVQSGTDPFPQCGSKVYPCATIPVGVAALSGNRTIVHLTNPNTLASSIDRDTLSLTIEGERGARSHLTIQPGGCFSLTAGTAATSFTLSQLVLLLPCSPLQSGLSVPPLITAATGRFSVVDCLFGTQDGAEDGAEASTSMTVASGEGGTILFDSVAFSHLAFAGGSRIAHMGSGSLTMEGCNITSVSGSGGGLVAGGAGAALSLKGLRVHTTPSTDGHFLKASCSAKVEIADGCEFEQCSSAAGDGGCVWCQMDGEGELGIHNSSIKACSVPASSGRGGGIFLHLLDQPNNNNNNNNFQLADLTFSANAALCGRDVFLMCTDLNESVKAARFVSLAGDGAEGEAEMEGTDTHRFGDVPVELQLFLRVRKAGEVVVSDQGYDVLGCGTRQHPCFSFWRGHANADASLPSRTMLVANSTFVQDALDVSGFLVQSSDDASSCTISVRSAVSSSAASPASAVLATAAKTAFLRILFDLPSAFSSGQSVFLSSSAPHGELFLTNITFSSASARSLSYLLLSAAGQSVHLARCVVQSLAFPDAPLLLMCTSTIAHSSFASISAPASADGGALKAVLAAEHTLATANTSFALCSCSPHSGRGGALFLDCTSSHTPNPFVLGLATSFTQNAAPVGRHVFVASLDLNATVTNSAFAFDCSPFASDPNAFVGSDTAHPATDLFRFLLPYQADAIYLSAAGSDVKRCGSEADPCESFWKGMQQVDSAAAHKTIFIDGHTLVQDPFDLSSFTVQSAPALSEGSPRPALNARSTTDTRAAPLFTNTRQLRLDSIAICTSASFANALQAVILSEGGDLVLTRCAFCSNATSHQPGDYSFVVCRGGTATADNLEMSDVCVVLPVFRLEGSCGCLVAGAAVRSARIASGCVFCFASGSAARTNGEARFVCTNSTFDTVTREDDGPCCVSAEPGSAVAAEMNSTVLESCRAGTSEWGGAWLCWLSGEGHMRMSQCRVVQCACSTRTGRGGGVCLASDLFGSLDFLFAKCAFDANTAWRGRDIFVQCRNIPSQINDTQFRFDLQPDKYNPVNAIFGADSLAPDPIDLMDFITVLQLSTVVVASAQPSPGEDSRQCGTPKLPCRTVGCALAHVYGDLFRMLAVDGQGVVNGEAVLEELSVCALDRLSADILFEGELVQTRDCLIEAVSAVAIECISFILPPSPPITHPALLHIRTGTLTLTRCNVGAPAQTPPPRIHTFLSVESAACTLRQVAVCNLACHAIAAAAGGSLVLHEVCAADVVCQSCAIAADSAEVTIASSRFTQMMADSPNTSSAHAAGAAALCLSRCNSLCVANCTFAGCSSPSPTGMSVRVLDSANAAIDCCLFDGLSHATHRLPPGNTFHEVCSWNGSMLHLQRGSAAVKDTAFANSPAGALSLSNGSATVAKCEFMSNNPSIEGYPSLRRNIICSDSGSLDVMSLKGGDGLKDGSSLWMLNDGCAFDGIVSERDSSFFIPVLESVETKEEANRMKLTFKGMLLVPCNLSFSVVKRKGDEKEIEHYDFDSNGFLSEREAEGSVAKDLISGCGSEIEVSVSILFGNSNAPSLTQPFILKNASEAKGTGNERIVEGGNKEMSIWPLIVIIVCIVCVILLVVIVVLTVRWKKQKRRTEELEVIVEDTVKKDPKAFEMVTMEMSPEDQWRRAEREAEKKNEERIKKRVYEKSLGHSESSEHLLSESGSTEYILGRDSDKIPQWMLEKEEDDEETRKRTPSPSVSSTSTTGTSDTDSTFVRGEDLCPTTSSMSNLVDAMACSSPHEKLIVDLRDSLFMLLHGKNKTKEMAIGTLKEREQTAAQILFWVANLSLHSFDEMDNPLSSLSNLSPHLVLFSEHMVICIVMHSDLLSDDDSDSSSISSSTVVTSTSNDDNDSLPSSAFEDEDSFKKECLRWKAPELLINKKMGATKESVAFSVGMMLWECLTLQIPFGDYEAEIAGEKIKNGERPPMQPIGSSAFSELVKACLSVNPADRQTLTSLKRLLIQHFPPGAAILTLSDAVDYTCCSDRQQQLSGSASCSSISATFIS
ncbi:uncharacterized protein MONOS_886 [Monocercomonoides exilis]|uniref:uncharacterized protein n=1 Tax=Monocercomonoides exilis TaxID=2049356 RepID=UPI0035597CD5|nr:hypothetical protein MONOS_886 [Monocercomonoides exilis]